MERSFECPICLEKFSSEIKPLLVPCGHTVCLDCLTRLKKERVFECPVCRTLHHNLNISALSINFALISSESRSSRPLWDKIEEIHKQSSLLDEKINKLNYNYEKSKLNTNKIKAEITQKYELMLTILTNSYKTLLAQIEGIEYQNTNNQNRIEFQLKKLQINRQELIKELKSAYDSNSEISNDAKLQLINLEIPEFDLNFDNYFLKSKDFQPEQFKELFGSVERTPCETERNKLEDVKMTESINIDKSKKDERDRYRGLNRDEGAKQPRQNKRDDIKWFVENRYGKWEKVPLWFDTQLKAAVDRGDNEVTILDNGKAKYLVKLQESLSYIIDKNGNVKRKKNRIKYSSD
jgi:zinc-RING finger domain